MLPNLKFSRHVASRDSSFVLVKSNLLDFCPANSNKLPPSIAHGQKNKQINDEHLFFTYLWGVIAEACSFPGLDRSLLGELILLDVSEFSVSSSSKITSSPL